MCFNMSWNLTQKHLADPGPVFNSDCAQADHKWTGKKNTLASTDPEELFPSRLWRLSKQCRSSRWIPALLSLCRWALQVSYSHASSLTLLMCILLNAKRWTRKKYRMAFQRCGFSYKTVTLHWVKTKIDIYNSIPGIFCCLYKFPQLIKLYGIHPM